MVNGSRRNVIDVLECVGQQYQGLTRLGCGYGYKRDMTAASAVEDPASIRSEKTYSLQLLQKKV